MTREQLNAALDALEGPDHDSRNELMVRNGRWGTCVDCPRSHGMVQPERCQNTRRGDHHLTVGVDAWELLRAYGEGTA